MVSQSQSRDIRGYFQAKPRVAPTKPASTEVPPAPSTESSALSSPLSSPSSSGAPPTKRPGPPTTEGRPLKKSRSATPVDNPSPPAASPTPKKIKTPPARSRDAVIADSDDSGSDDSLEDLGAIWQRANPNAKPTAPPPRRTSPAACTTPQKRIALGPHATTPLTIRAKRMAEAHRYDMNALLRLNEADKKAEAAGERMSALFRSRDKKGDSSPGPDVDGSTADAIEKHLEDYGPEDVDDPNGDGKSRTATKAKLKRAIKRVEANSSSRCYYFFKGAEDDAKKRQSASKFPTSKATGGWRFLKDPKSRPQHFLSGLPYQLAKREYALPEELLVWILKQIALEESRRLRNQYAMTVSAAIIVSEGGRPLGHRIDDGLLGEVFGSLGCRGESVSGLLQKLPLDDEVPDPYPGRNWARLISVLNLFENLARRDLDGGVAPLTLATITTATQLLLRLGLDRAVLENSDVLEAYQAALEALVECVPPADWTDFCYGAGNCIYTSVESAHLRWQPLSWIAADSPRLHDFRRRLALVFFFDDLACARQAPDQVTSLESVVRRVRSGPFRIQHNTNYQELAGMLRLLNVAVDGGFEADRVAAAGFDAMVDELTGEVGTVWRSIVATGGGHTSRLDSKTVAEWLPDRLKFAVRTRPPPKNNIYKTQQDGPQQQTIKKWFASPKRDIKKEEVKTEVMAEVKSEVKAEVKCEVTPEVKPEAESAVKEAI